MPELRYYPCGETVHDIARLMRGAPRERRVFPAGVFLYDDGVRRILFDTGYAPEPWRAGVSGGLYRRLLPPAVPEDATVDRRLAADGYDVADITHVVLSHLHPDHIGGVRFFPRATFVLSAGAARTLASPRLKEGVLAGLLPKWFSDARRIVVDDFVPGPHGLRVASPFGDDGYRIVDLPGHARGHIGALVEGRMLLAGDAAWTRELLGREAGIRLLPRLVGHDRVAQAATARALLRAEREGVRLLLSHDPHEQGRSLL